MAKRDRSGNRKPREQGGLIHVLKYGYMLILGLCRQFKILGLVVLNLDEYMKTKQDRHILKRMINYMRKSVNMVTRKKQFR